MRKKLIILMAVSCIMLSACGTNKPEAPEPDQHATSTEYRSEKIQERKEELKTKEGAAEGNVTYIGSQYGYEDEMGYFNGQDNQSLDSGSDTTAAENSLKNEEHNYMQVYEETDEDAEPNSGSEFGNGSDGGDENNGIETP